MAGVLASLVVAANALAQQGPSFRPVPAWVETQSLPEIPASTPEGISDGLHYLLFDTQYRVTADERYRYGHMAYRIIDRAGLESGARLTFEFDPEDTELIVHSIAVVRDGEVLDRLDRDRFSTIRRETDLQAGIINGDLTSFIELRDVRVGDVVTYQYSSITHSQIWPGGLAASLSTQWSIPIERRSVSILARSGMPLSVAGTADIDPHVDHADGWTTYSWQIDNPERLTGESQVPEGYSTWPYLSLSNMPDWASVVNWGRPLYANTDPLPASARALIDQVNATHSSTHDRITALIRYVQDDIRYVSDSTGLGSHVPRSPTTVIANGYGDCKDKALLLTQLLRAIGVTADVALTDIDEGRGLPHQAPSPYAFDHVIVRIEQGGETVWVDATSSHHGGVFPDLAEPVFGYALPLRAGQTELESIPVQIQALPSLRVMEIFDFADATEDGVELSVVSAYRHHQANGFRSSIANGSRLAISENYLDYYQGHYPGIEIDADLEVEDDRDANLILVREYYHLSAEAYQADELPVNFAIRGDAVLGRISQIDADGRTAPIALTWPLHQTHVHRLINTPFQVSGLPPLEMETTFLRYTTESRSTAETSQMSYTLQTLSDRAPAGSAAAYNSIAQSVEDTADLRLDLSVQTGPLAGFHNWIERPGNDTLFGFGLVAGLYILLFFGAILGLRRDRNMPDGAVFFPVSPLKFVAMSVASFNLFAVFWVWRNWRWVRAEDEVTISPLGRSIFNTFFFPALAARIDSESESGFLGRLFLVGSAILFSIVSVTSKVAERVLSEDDSELWISGILILANALSCLLALPAVLRVNSLNRPYPEVQAYNSRWSFGSIVLLVYGFAFLTLSLIGSFTEQ